jgi:hypothetical protein
VPSVLVSLAGSPLVGHRSFRVPERCRGTSVYKGTVEWVFAFDRAARFLLAPLGIRPATARVRVTKEVFEVDFGPWRLRTPAGNITAASVTGPYRWIKAVGPRLSLADRGVTFGTNGREGVCILFHEPVPSLDPLRLLRHPGATVTVEEPGSLVAFLHRIRG